MATLSRTYSRKRKPASGDDGDAADAVASVRPRKKPALGSTQSKSKPKQQQTKLVQLHLALDQNPHRTCKLCSLTYTRGSPEDEALHKVHCDRVQKGLEWTRDEDKDADRAGLVLVDPAVNLPSKLQGRIVSLRADAAGKSGSKVTSVIDTMNTVLSAPPLSNTTLKATKVYLFLTKPKGATREHIAGCILAHRIRTAHAVLDTAPDSDSPDGVQCDPTPLPTPLGIPRVFVPRAYRRKGIAKVLFDAATRTAVHGCRLSHDQVAFSQPTGDGRILMNHLGITRVYEEDSDDADSAA